MLDAVFSLDSIITATGMIVKEQAMVMYIAVIIAMGVMMWGSGTLMRFINRHPTIVILCLGFLMMVGFTLIVEGFGFHIPKGYLYAAIGFSVVIEAFNQIGRRNREKMITTNDLRERTADAVLRLLGGGKKGSNLSETVDVIVEQAANSEIFRPEEKEMIRGVLDLADRPVRSIMSPRNEIEWLDLSGDESEMREELQRVKHSRLILAREKIDEFVGVALTKDLLLNLAEGKKINWQKAMREPLVVHENTGVLRLMEKLRHSSIQLAIIVDEHGSLKGIATPTDIFEAIAGDFPDDDEESVVAEKLEDGNLLVEGYADIRRLSGYLERNLVDESDRYTTLAGFMLWRLGHLPNEGESFEAEGLCFKVIEMDRRNISKVLISQLILQEKY
ncbi:CBS domain-containing protein [Bartonella sp. JB15]|nr:CBS domain-containing protein [Bartonella sp. JB15]